ncbi:MAG: protein kinase [Deltaproteobacteria bacterium]|nr:protein kinase [Deltaproteobacteria bacterium]
MADAPPSARLGRALASPTGVLILLPLLVIAAGVIVMLLGRRATRDASDTMARRLLAAQAADVQHDVAFALDQADPLLASLRTIADENMAPEEAAIRMRDLVIARPGVANVSLAWPSGRMRGTYIDNGGGELRVQESVVGTSGTARTNYTFVGGVHVESRETTTYDPRTRPHYTLATQTKQRVWMPPRTFFTSHKTGLTVTEPVYAASGELQSVLTVDFDVGELSSFIARPVFEGSRTVMFAGDGTVLAFPSVPLPAAAVQENRLLRHEDFNDPALEALFRVLGTTPATELRFLQLQSKDGEYLASVAPVGGKRAGIAAPLDWYLATLVPERVLLGPTHRLEKQSLLASGGALLIAMGVALMFAWNLVRMRKAVGAARAAARSAEARAKELGSYRLVSRLGAGGMGEVWRAEHRLLARQAAIKLVRPEALRDPRYAPKIRERFRREAQTLASMRSRNTIELYDYGVTDDGTFFYVMELLDGVDLDHLVRDHGALPAARVIRLLAQACQSLAEAHDAGLLHRDIKPANLFACRAADEVDVLKVLDFGIVHTISDPQVDPIEIVTLPSPHPTPTDGPRPSGRLTQAGSVVGTPGYISPEMAFAAPIDARADIYALACVAWWLLTRREVFTGPDEDAVIAMHAHDPIPALRPHVPGWLPDALESLIIRCLAKRPQERPADARALLAELRAIDIPAEHAWTDEMARAWWTKHRPPVDDKAPPVPAGTSVERVIVTQHEEPVAAIGPEAKTVVSSRRSS